VTPSGLTLARTYCPDLSVGTVSEAPPYITYWDCPQIAQSRQISYQQSLHRQPRTGERSGGDVGFAVLFLLVALRNLLKLQQIQPRQLRNDRSILRAGSTKEQVGSNAGSAVKADNSL